jgi:DedD protein
MDRQLLERMIGAGVLMVALIIVAPAILDGQRESGEVSYTSDDVESDAVRRTHTIHLDKQSDKPPVARQVSKSSPVTAKPAPVDKPPAPALKPAAKPASVKVVAASPAPKSQVSKAAGWSVQLGSFAQRRNAERLAAEVGGRGFKTYLVPLEKSERTLYRVRVGPRDSRAEAEKLSGRLAEAGYKGQVTAP